MEGGGDGRREGIFWSGRGLGVVWAPPGHDRPEIISFERGSPDKNTHFRAGPFFRIFWSGRGLGGREAGRLAKHEQTTCKNTGTARAKHNTEGNTALQTLCFSKIKLANYEGTL